MGVSNWTVVSLPGRVEGIVVSDGRVVVATDQGPFELVGDKLVAL